MVFHTVWREIVRCSSSQLQTSYLFDTGDAEDAGDIARVMDHEKDSTDFLAEPRAMIPYDRANIPVAR